VGKPSDEETEATLEQFDRDDDRSYTQ